METIARGWPALWALVLGFFMIMVDTTIVYIATPAIMTGPHTDINSVVWVTSAYLLAYAVPLLITGRLGDRFGPKNLYLAGLVVFTLASVWSGFAGDITMLILARAVQGLGASLLTPQTMAVITRIFPPDRRGAAMGALGRRGRCRQRGHRGAHAGSPGGPAAWGIRRADRWEGALPKALHAGFSTAMGQSLLLPAAVAVLGAIVVLFFVRPTRTGWAEQAVVPAEQSVAG